MNSIYKYYIGIDPGKNGGMAIITEKLGVYVSPMSCDGKYIDFGNVANFISRCTLSQTIVCIEKVHAMPQQGVTSMFSFGIAFGGLLGVVSTLKVATALVPPQRWKKYVLVDTDKSKEAAVSFCKMRYPDVNLYATERSKKPHSGICDALCIAHYACYYLMQ